MKEESKGMKRRVDTLGRVVIPKEIRSCLRIDVGDLIEFCLTEKNSVIMKKYYILSDLKEMLSSLIRMTVCEKECSVFIVDTDNIICSNEILTENILSNDFKDLIKQRKECDIENICLTKGKTLRKISFFPIICNGDLYGGIVVSGEDKRLGKNLMNFIVQMLEK